MLINRRGQIEECFVGDSKRVYLPDIGRQRGGAGHLRGLRHVHTVLDDYNLTRDDYADLNKLRLDAVAAFRVDDDGRPGVLQYAYPQPGARDSERQITTTASTGT